MNIWIVIPTKPFAEGKTRLSARLSDSERERLNREFFTRTLTLAVAVVPPERVVVASRSNEVRQLSHRVGAAIVAESETEGLNQALAGASNYASERGAEAVLSLSCDLPFLEVPDIETMLDASSNSPCMLIAGDRAERGTNALLLSPPALISYRYGAESFQAHFHAARKAGANANSVNRPALAFDIDTPEDFAEWQSSLRGT